MKPTHKPKRPTLSAGLPVAVGADAALAVLVVAVVGLMVVPLPTWLLDILLATNLSAAIAILLVVLYVPDALGIAAFPTLLLITTLVRLALNVSSTRLILLSANAGEVIRAFGQFVVRGNYVVGAVIFLILTIIQFIVIAKGSERVAEVGARFVLDAMPGKQMAIDAEVRSGALDANEARRRRHKLARESQFYGAMDGAMKFVKGDVIASVIIACINILAGLAIGIGQRGLTAESALKRYGLLTIGDGLVTQIPALVLSTAAGILVTRVASEEPDRSLGSELAAQVFSTPKALQVAGLFVFGLGVVPGLPTVPFLLLGTLLLVSGQSRLRRLRLLAQSPPAEPTLRTSTGPRGPLFLPVVVPWSIHVSADLTFIIEDELRGSALVSAGLLGMAQQLRERLFADLGVPLPAARIRTQEALPDGHVVILLYEVPARVIVVERDSARSAAVSKIELSLYELLRQRASDYIGMAETQQLLDQLEQVAPALVRQVVPKPVALSVLSDVLRRLVEEGINIRDMRSILEALAMVAPTEKDPLNLAEFVRSQLRRSITYKLTQGRPELTVYLLDSSIEEAIRHAIARTAGGSFLTLAPAAARDIVTAVRRAFSQGPPPPAIDNQSSASAVTTDRVVLTQPDIRRFVRKLLETELPDTSVISFAELLPEIALRPLAKATLVGIG